MTYVLTGRLRTHACGGSLVPVANATLMIYRPGDEAEEGFTVRDHEQIRDHEFRLMCQSRTDDQGEFRVQFGEKTIFGYRGSTHVFAGEAFVLDVLARSADGAALDHDPEPVQFSLGEFSLDWQDQGADKTAHLDHEISESDWSRVREALDTWTIVGRVVGADKNPRADLKVSAYDADLVQDDFLGSASTDAEGQFRIDYAGTAFRQTAVGAGYERGGPELYFIVESQDGSTLLKEDKSRGNKPDRADASNCFSVELTV